MHAAIAAKKAQIAELCRRFGVQKLEIFGSGARGDDFDPETSDADFLVRFNSSAPRTLDQYFDFKYALSETLGRPVDLIAKREIRNRYLQESINASREVVHEE